MCTNDEQKKRTTKTTTKKSAHTANTLVYGNGEKTRESSRYERAISYTARKLNTKHRIKEDFQQQQPNKIKKKKK